MKNPTLLKGNVSREEAEELMDYLYCERIEYTQYSKDGDSISWYSDGEHIARWTDAFKNIMISKDFLLTNY